MYSVVSPTYETKSVKRIKGWRGVFALSAQLSKQRLMLCFFYWWFLFLIYNPVGPRVSLPRSSTLSSKHCLKWGGGGYQNWFYHFSFWEGEHISEKVAQIVCTGGWQGIIWAMPKRKSVFFFWEGFPNFAPFPTEFAVNSISQADFPVSDENTYFQSPSKHLKGQLGPRVGHITFFNQRRSVVSHCHIMFLNYQPSWGETLRTPQTVSWPNDSV